MTFSLNKLELFFLFSIVLFVYNPSKAQFKTVISKINGKVVASDSIVLRNAFIYNSSTHQKTRTNSKGDFSLLLRAGDTIYFGYPGYKSKKMFFIKKPTHSDYSILIVLNIDNDAIYNNYILSRSHEVFNKDIKNIDNGIIIRSSNLNKLAPIKLNPHGDTTKYAPNGFQSPISYFYNEFNKKAVQQRKLKRIREYRKEQMAKDSINNK